MATLHKILKNFDKRLNHEDIDVFLDHLNASVNGRLKRLEYEIENLGPDDMADERDLDMYREHLVDMADSSRDAKALADELSIIALHKKVDAHTIRVVKKYLPLLANKKLANFDVLNAALPFQLKNIDGFESANELRLLSNCIKHADSVVTKTLADAYPHWTEGEELQSLDQKYRDLLPGSQRFAADLVETLYAEASKP